MTVTPWGTSPGPGEGDGPGGAGDDGAGPDGIGPGGAGPDGVADEPPPLFYASLDEFVENMVVPVFLRQVGERAPRRWQAEWWRSSEAVIRLEAMWRSWENLRLDPATGISVWLRDHADYHLAVLMDPDGPFARSTDAARPGEPLPCAPAPTGMFPRVR